jgi:putative flippase GtrA
VTVIEPPNVAPSAPLRAQLVRYLLVGGVAVLIDAGAYYVLVALRWLEPAGAKRVSFAMGAVWGFFANKFFTFGQRTFALHEPVLFTFVYLAGWILNSLLHDAVLAFTGWRTLAFLVATGTSTCTNFAGQKWIVFRTRSRTSTGD